MERPPLERYAQIFELVVRNVHHLSSVGLTAASIFAGESMFGSPSIDITESKIASTPKIGLHRSSAFSCSLNKSCPGG